MASESAALAEKELTNEKAPFLLFDGDPRFWREDAYAAWCAAEAEVTLEFAAPIRVGRDSTILIVVDPTNVGDFERRWLSWSFEPKVDVVVVLLGIAEEDLWLGQRAPHDFVQVSSSKMSNPTWIIGAIVSAVRTGRVVFVPVSATALPGAELFLDEEWSAFEAVLHSSDWLRAPCIDDTAAALCIPFFALLRTNVLERIPADDEILSDSTSVARFITRGLLRQKVAYQNVDVKNWGWRLREVLMFVETESE
jgi:hypothetical protein